MLWVLTALLAAAQAAPPVQPTLPTQAEVRASPPTVTPPMAADPAVAAEIIALEKRWGEAFIARDFAFIETIIAPEFRLSSVGSSGRMAVTSRADWFRNSRAFQHLGFFSEVIQVTTAGDTAVAQVRTSWKRKPFADRPPMTTSGIMTDTWVRRGGRWQVISRYSHRLDDAPWRLDRPAPAR